ncbi:carbamoyltransferase C-terminal domain-containing protein [Saccharothrix sp. Mg75]|uniref:carbamoyltransferase C-terminal domain-containing protein n=1 Tax=Saccharothrix sp. Mg75 TaxID=3445357 RepID=UPI003EEA0910
MRIVGVNLSHDSSMSLVEDGRVVAALALERITQQKRGTVPWHEYTLAMTRLAIEVLGGQGLTIDDVDYWIGTSTESGDQNEEERLLDILGVLAPTGKRLALPHPAHHLAHASAAFYTSGLPDAAAVVVDTYGSIFRGHRERETAFEFSLGARPKELFRMTRSSTRIAGTVHNGGVYLPENIGGLGELYRVVTLALGFRESGTAYDDAGKTMGLAPYGKRLSADSLFIDVSSGEMRFDNATRSLVDLGFAKHAGTGAQLLPRQRGEAMTQLHKDLAYQIQVEFEEAMLFLTNKSLEISGSRNVVLSGGCFLNSTTNARLARELDIDAISVFPAATDDGNAAGAALYAHYNIVNEPGSAAPADPKSLRMMDVYLGPPRVAKEQIEQAAKTWSCDPVHHADENEMVRAAAEAIERGEIIGWFQDRAEYGPRALGSRSILCHPGLPGMKDRLNARVKFREAFRPFAASVLAERAVDYFEIPVPDSPFMLFVCPVLPEKREAIEEITHVDGTCRIQTVAAEQGGKFRKLIERFDELTGVPMILNTSFNLRTKPIVETAGDALNCLFGSRLDRLFIGQYEFTAPNFADMVPTSLTADGEKGPSDPREATILGLVDGSRSVRRIAEEAGLDVEVTINLILDMRRREFLDWANLPNRYRELTIPTPQYQQNFSESR